jgi:tetratricopeptide (TPR) repeat protein
MWNLFRKKTIPPPSQALLDLRARLFAMDDLDELVNGLSEAAKLTPPWSYFVAARSHRQAGQLDQAVAALQQVLESPKLESRVYLWAWYNLRSLGLNPPPDQAYQVRGMVVEIPHPQGRDVLAAYADHQARYLDRSGGVIFWDAQDAQIDDLIDALLESGGPALERAQAWNKPEPGPPPPGFTRISILTDAGLHFGQGPYWALSRDALGGPPLAAAERLARTLVNHPAIRKTEINRLS